MCVAIAFGMFTITIGLLMAYVDVATILKYQETIVPLRICLMLALLLCAIPAKAELVIDVLASNVFANGTPGFIDVAIRSRVGETHNVSLAAYEFAIANVGSPIGSLEFLSNQLTDEQANAAYLFSTFQPTGNFTAIANSPISYTGGDFTNSPNAPFPSTLVTSTNLLLVRLDVRYVLPANTDSAQAVGSQFSVSLVDANSSFQDENGDPIAFSSTPGIATITAVPEPSSLLLVLAVGAAAITLRRKQIKVPCAISM